MTARNAVEPSRYLMVWDDDGGLARCDADDEPMLAERVREVMESGKDSLVHLTTVGGLSYTIRASKIASWMDSTAESRQRQAEFDAAMKIEEQSNGGGYE